MKSEEELFKTDMANLSENTLNLIENRMERKIET